jgi:hypothetical protein
LIVRVNGRVAKTLRGKQLRLALRKHSVKIVLPERRGSRVEVEARGRHRSTRTTRRYRC